MANKNGHWYTDKNGNHYFVEEGQTPQEGWEASKRRKMINGGKYMTSEDGNDYSEVDKDKYDAYEADEADFDENVDDDFGFDEDGDDYDEEEKVRYLDKIYNRYFDNQENWKRNETGNYEIGDDENYGYVLNDGERPGMIRAGRVRNADHEHPEEEFFEDPQEAKEWVEEVANGEYNREMQRAQEQNAMLSEGQDDDFNRGQTVDAPEKGQGWKKTKMASGTLYEGPNGERYMDDGSAPEKVKIGAKEMTADEWKDWYHKLDDNNREMGKEFLLNHASEFDMSERDMEKFLTDGSQNYIDSPEFKKIQEFGKRLKYNDADSRDGYLTQDEYNDVVGFAAKYNLSEEKLKEMGFGDYSGGIIDEINNSKRNQQPENDDPVYSHFMKKFNTTKEALDNLRSYDYDRSKYKDNSKLTWRDPVEKWADPVKDFAEMNNVSEDDVREFLNRAYDRTNKGPLKDGTDIYGIQENEMKSRYQKIREVLGDNADETIEWLFNHLSKLNDYKK